MAFLLPTRVVEHSALFRFPRLPGDDDPATRRCNDLGERPELWLHLEAPALEDLLSRQVVGYGMLADDRRVPPLKALYGVAAGRLDREARRRVCEEVIGVVRHVHGQQRVIEGVGLINALWPFVFDEPDRLIVSRAARAAAVFVPLKDGHPMTGPQMLLDSVHDDVESWRQGAVVGGLLSIGDRRVVALAGEVFVGFAQEARRAALDVLPELPGAALIDWLLNVLERDLDSHGDVHGDVVGYLAASGRRLRLGGRPIEEHHQVFPGYLLAEPTRTTGRVFAEYAASIGPRLRAIAAREPEPHIVPVVQHAWGLEPACGRHRGTRPSRCAPYRRSRGRAAGGHDVRVSGPQL